MKIPFDDDVEQRVIKGDLVPLALFMYEPETELLLVYPVGRGTLAETVAMIKKYLRDIPEPVGDDG